MSGKWQESKEGGRGKERWKKREQGKDLIDEKSKGQSKRRERICFMTPHKYRNVEGGRRDGKLKQRDTGEGKRKESGEWKSFCHPENLLEVLERGGGRGGGEGGITVQENDLGTHAISHWKSRPDTTASIIQMTMANERDPNKSPRIH